MNQDTVTPTLSSVALIYFLQQWLKEPPEAAWGPFATARACYQTFVRAFPGADKWAHRFFAGVSSVCVAAGLHYTLDGDCTWAQGCHGTFSIPDGWTVLSGLWEWLKVYALQALAYTFTRQSAVSVATVSPQGAVVVATTQPMPGGHP